MKFRVLASTLSGAAISFLAARSTASRSQSPPPTSRKPACGDDQKPRSVGECGDGKEVPVPPIAMATMRPCRIMEEARTGRR